MVAPPKPYGGAYLPKRTDANQSDIVSAFRHLGYTVTTLHTVGGGVFDLLVGKWRINLLVEVKDGVKVPSAREFTPKQKQFNFTWTGHKCVATCKADVLSIDRQFRALVSRMRTAGINPEIDFNIKGSLERMYEPSLY